jgi:hypothetical protein
LITANALGDTRISVGLKDAGESIADLEAAFVALLTA